MAMAVLQQPMTFATSHAGRLPHLKTHKHRPKNLLIVAVHVGFDIGQEGGSHKVALLIARDLNPSAI